MKEGQKVYKLVGPVLIRVDISEAMSNVDNRLKLLQRQSYVHYIWFTYREEMAEKAKKENEHYKEIEDEVGINQFLWSCSLSNCNRKLPCWKWRICLNNRSSYFDFVDTSPTKSTKWYPHSIIVSLSYYAHFKRCFQLY